MTIRENDLENMSYDRAHARRALAEFRNKRRSQTPDSAARLCEALDYEVDTKRGKGSHWLAERPGALPLTIPTGNKVLGLKTATSILRFLEEVFDRDDENEQHG